MSSKPPAQHKAAQSEANQSQRTPAKEGLDAASNAPKRRKRSITRNVNATRRLGRYELAFELASGGFAVVYLARVMGPGGFEKFVALKRIHSHMASEKEFVEMFLDEARIAACINHPNVCPVFDFGNADGAYYLAMDYVFGEPLSQVIRALRKTGDLELRNSRFPYIARIIADAADGLHAAHEALGPGGDPLNVVHRDVAPANLFLRYDGHMQIVDFGIASATGKMHMTATGVMKGHLSYVSPEQFQGEAADRRVDVWSLGVILWEMLAGRRLYKRETDVKTMFAVTDEPYYPARLIDPSVPEEIEAIVRKALAKNRQERFQTARELSKALHRYLRSLDEGVDSHDVAAWLRKLMPGAQQKRQQLLDQARAVLQAGNREPLTSLTRERKTSVGTGPELARKPQKSSAKREAATRSKSNHGKRSSVEEWWSNPWFWVALSGIGALGGALWSLIS